MTLWKLRRLAPRVVRILARNLGTSVSIDAIGPELTQVAQDYMGTYDQLRTLDLTRAKELAEGKQTVAELHSALRGWVAIVTSEAAIPDFEGSEFGANSVVMDDVISDAEAFIRIITEHQDSVSVSEALLADLGAAVEKAKTEWGEADALKQDYQNLVVQNRENAAKLHRMLVAFRKLLASTIGRNSPDYQTLRSAKIDREVLEPGEEEDLPESLIPTQPGAEDSDENEEALEAAG